MPHVRYVISDFEGMTASKCKNMTTDRLSIATAEDTYSYCSRHGMDFMEFALKKDSEMIYKMCIADYLLSNPDRHGRNWGFYEDNSTGRIIRCHPLFDHNNAFDKEEMHDISGGKSLIFDGKTKREAAEYSMQRTDFRCISPLTRDDFMTDKMHESFMKKACAIGLYKEIQPSLWKVVINRLQRKSSPIYEPASIKPDNSSTYTDSIILDDIDSKNVTASVKPLDTLINEACELEHSDIEQKNEPLAKKVGKDIGEQEL